MTTAEQRATKEAIGVQETTASSAVSEQLHHFHLAYARLKPRLDAIPAEQAVRITLNVAGVVQAVLGVLPELEKLRSELQRECPGLKLCLITELQEAVCALGHLEALKRGSRGQLLGVTVTETANRIRALRDILLADVQPLVARGLLDAKALVLTPGNSPRNVAFDTLRLVNYLDENSPRLAGKTLATQQDLDAARAQAQELMTFLAVRDNTEESAELALTRQRAMTHLLRIYEELRWAVRYTRRAAKDGDWTMPSLYSLRKRRGSGSGKADAEEALATVVD